MTPPEPPGESSGGFPRPSDPSAVTGSMPAPGHTGPIARSRAPWFGEGGAARRFLGRWGFPLFVLLILILGREVLLPFVFAGLIAYILSPVVRWMADRRDGTRRMHRGLAIVMCYVAFISVVAGLFVVPVAGLCG